MTALIYDYPQTAEIEEIEQKLLPKLTSASPAFSIMPFDSANERFLIWEQLDNFRGLQQLRGWNGLPQTVNRLSSNRYVAQAGVYGEKIILDEEELTNRRAMATFGGGPIPISDLVGQALAQLLNRRLNRVEKIIWDLLISGAFSIANEVSGVTYSGSYTQQSFTPDTAWSDLANSTPLKDMRTYRGFEAGQSCSFGAGAVQYVNYVTLNYLLNNTNADDLGGKRMAVGSTLNNADDLNRILIMNDIPPVQVYNRGYIDDADAFHYFIPSGKVCVIGNRPTGRKIGRYRFTRNINSPNAAAAPYVRVLMKGDREIPASVEVHDGHNGGPIIQFPGSQILVNAA